MNETIEEMKRLSASLDEGLDLLRQHALELAEAEHAYRRSKAKAWVIVSREGKNGAKRLAAEVEAEVDEMTCGLRFKRDQAEAVRQAALEMVRSRRQQISAWQSWAALERAEAEFVRTGPDR
jgi:hypothetical protein